MQMEAKWNETKSSFNRMNATEWGNEATTFIYKNIYISFKYIACSFSVGA